MTAKVIVGNVSVETTFTSKTYYDKSGQLRRERYMHTTYRNIDTGRIASNADLAEVGIKHRQAANVKLTSENASFLFRRAERAERGDIKPKSFANLIGSKTFGVPDREQMRQFKDALRTMFEKSNPSEEELARWNELIDKMTPEECQRFYEQHQRALDRGFEGYRSKWTNLDRDAMPSATRQAVLDSYNGGDMSNVIATQKANRDTVRAELLPAAENFLKSIGKL